MTLVGSSPLILLNDLILTANSGLPESQQIEPFGLFSVTPVGAMLIVTGILYFVLLGRWVLPAHSDKDDATSGQTMQAYMRGTYGLNADIFEVLVPDGNILVGQTLNDIMDAHHLYIIGTDYRGKKVVAPMVDTRIETPCRLGFSLLAIHRGEEVLSLVETEEHEACRLGDQVLRSGDTLAVHAPWDALARLLPDRDFVVVTTDFPQEDLRPQKVNWALGFFAIALVLILFTDMRLSLCLLVGAVGMILSKVLTVDEAYSAVSWQTVFLLASLIPLGQAVQETGTAAWIAQQILVLLDGWPLWALQAGLAVLATAFTLVMSNVGATVLLVPLAVSIAVAAGGDPGIFALTVAIATSNSFLIPTHQVNALIMGPAGYRVADFVKAGSLMTVLFLVVSLVALNLFY